MDEIKKKAFIYTRVSTSEQAEEGYSLGEQEDHLTKFCDAMGWELVKVYSDPAYSGSNMERPNLKEMLKDVEKGKTDIILVDKLDRLSRSQFDTLYMIQKVFNPNKVAFVSRSEAFDTSTPFGKAMVGILAVFAELERERIKERMMEGKEGRIKEGKFRGGYSIPLGYDYDKEKGILVPNEYEAMIVNEIFEMISKRIPINTIAAELNEKGFKSKHNKAFEGTCIRKMAVNKTFIGMQRFHGEWMESLHEPIISQELFDRVQGIMEERKITNERYSSGRKYNSVLGGMIWCGKCGAKYHWKKNGNAGCYVCYSRSKSDSKLVKDPNCKNDRYNDKILEEAIYGEIRKLRSDPLYIDNVRNSIDQSEKIEKIRNQIASISKQIAKYMELYAVDGIDKNDVASIIKPLTEERNLLENEVSFLEKEQIQIKDESVVTLASMFEKVIASGNNSRIRNVIKELIEYIVIDGETVQIHWNF